MINKNNMEKTGSNLTAVSNVVFNHFRTIKSWEVSKHSTENIVKILTKSISVTYNDLDKLKSMLKAEYNLSVENMHISTMPAMDYDLCVELYF